MPVSRTWGGLLEEGSSWRLRGREISGKGEVWWVRGFHTKGKPVGVLRGEGEARIPEDIKGSPALQLVT